MRGQEKVSAAAGIKLTTLAPQGCPIADSPLDTSPVWDLSANGESFKTLYIMPVGSLSDRLAAVASAATLARNARINFIVVWPEGGDPDFAAAWSDLYESPKLPTGPFPSGKYSPVDTGCIVHTIKSYADYKAVENKWEKVSQSSQERALCLVSSSNFLPGSKDAAWFYKSLTPSPQVMALVTPFVEELQWARWGQWIGIDACTAKECIDKDTKTTPKALDFLTVARQFASMPLDGESVPRFFIVSDDPTEEESIKEMIWNMNLTGAKGAAAVFPSQFKFKQPTSVAGLREIAAQLYLLSETVLVIGTPGSTRSTAAAAAGESYLVFAESNGHLHSDLNVTRVKLPGKEDVRAALLGGRSRGGLGGGGGVATVAKSRHMAG